MNWRTWKSKLKQMKSDDIQVYFVALCWVGIFIALMVYGYRHPAHPKRELPKDFHREWSGKFY